METARRQCRCNRWSMRGDPGQMRVSRSGSKQPPRARRFRLRCMRSFAIHRTDERVPAGLPAVTPNTVPSVLHRVRKYGRGYGECSREFARTSSSNSRSSDAFEARRGFWLLFVVRGEGGSRPKYRSIAVSLSPGITIGTRCGSYVRAVQKRRRYRDCASFDSNVANLYRGSCAEGVFDVPAVRQAPATSLSGRRSLTASNIPTPVSVE